MPIVHDPQSGKFMPGPHAKGGGGGWAAAESSGGSGDNPAMKHESSQQADKASEKAKEQNTKEAHLDAAKKHSQAQQHHTNESFDAKGKTAKQHEDAADYHATKQQEHIKAAREIASAGAPSLPASHPNPTAWERSEYKDWSPSRSERQALHDYSLEGYKTINSDLRRGEPLSKRDQATFEHLQSAIDKAGPVKENLTVFRSMSANLFDSTNVGSTYQDKGFMSTTLQREAIAGWEAHGGGGRHALVTIDVKKGAKGAPLIEHSARKGEGEFLLPPNSKLTITKKIEHQGRLYVFATVD